MDFQLFLNGNSGMVTIIWVVLIFAVFIFFLVRLLNAKGNNQKLKDNRISFESMATTLSTLGVLGTFFGITWGLMGFNVNDLDNSIPILLGGLKTAFFTSLAGMFCSLIYNGILNKVYDAFETSQPSTQDESVAKICDAITKMRETSSNAIETIKSELATAHNNQTAFYNAALMSLNGVNKEFLDSYKEDIKGVMNSILLQATAVGSQLKPLTLLNDMGTDISDIAKKSGDQLNEIKVISETNKSQLTEAKAYTDVLHTEVANIEGKMKETHEILTQKFNEFSELLKKSNTEALVEVMKGLTQEFQKQMGTLIERLVKENFNQLNNSVKQLNTWQIENKAMIQSLTTQYNQMSENFAKNADALNQLTQDTSQLVGDGGKLQELLTALTKVMVDDTKFVEITKNLEDTAQLSKDNMAKFDESTEKLNDWVRKQRNFVDAVVQLMGKLEEINKINDYSSEFWRETKKGMEDSVGIIKTTSQSLNANLRSINQEFYERLASTLSELDTCIQAMVRQRNSN